MKHTKRIISLLVALCLVAAMTVSAFATESGSSSEATSSEVTIATTLADGKIVYFDKLNNEDFVVEGDNADAIAANGLLYANGKEINTAVLDEEVALGKTWQVTATFVRDNQDKAPAKNCLGEKFELNAGEFSFKIGNQQEGVAQYVAELWKGADKLGDVQITGDISATYAIRYTQDSTNKGRVYVVKDGSTMRWNVLDTIYAPNEAINGVTSFFVVDGAEDGATSKISVTAAGNDSKDKTNYVYGLSFAKKFYATYKTGDGNNGATGTSSGAAGGNSGATGDLTPIVFIVLALVAAGAVVVFTTKKPCEE